jgi:hypothetical protein
MSELLEWAVEVESHLCSTLSWAMLVAAIMSDEGQGEGWPSEGGAVLELRDSIHELVAWTCEQGVNMNDWKPCNCMLGAMVQCFCC